MREKHTRISGKPDTVGFGTPSKLYTLINVSDPREIIVIGFVETELDQYLAGLEIDVKERLNNPLDDIIEPVIERKFGILVSEDDFSDAGSLAYRSPRVCGTETDVNEISGNLAEIAQMIAQVSAERDRKKRETGGMSP